jgi:predicted ATPase/DNA-binding CsgD family transcriptional regulator
MTERAEWLPLPLVGRDEELATARRALDAAATGACGSLIISGGFGVGKTRLLESVVDDASSRGFTVAAGRAYLTDANVPYAIIADALTPLISALEPETLTVLARGAEGELAHVIPAIDPRSAWRTHPPAVAGDLTTRVRWHFAQFHGRLTARQPLLLALDNVQWADPSSIALLQFTLRHAPGARVLCLTTFNSVEADASAPFRTLRRSLASSATSHEISLETLTEHEVHEMLVRAFGTTPATVSDFTARLYARTLGNPFFVEEMLKSLAERDKLRFVDGRWTGWTVEDFELPATVREVVLSRFAELSQRARHVAEIASIFGSGAQQELLQGAAELTSTEFVDATEELHQRRIISEIESGGDVAYTFTHPLLQRTIYEEIGTARRRELHGRVAQVMEKFYGKTSDRHATDLAYHFARAGGGATASKSFRYLTVAGRDAFDRHADREAVAFLQHALELAERVGSIAADDTVVVRLVEDLAKARQRIADYESATTLWLRARELRRAAGDDIGLARAERRLGLLTYWSGQVEQSLAHYDSALAYARRAGNADLEARTLLAKGTALANLGRQQEAKSVVHEALVIVEASGDVAARARVERTLMLLYTFTGPGKTAIEFGRRVLEHAKLSGDIGVAWSAHWASAVLAGLTANGKAAVEHIAEARRLARELNSPILAANIAEVAIEYAAANGDWAEALAVAEENIPIARAVGPRTLLPRILVWTGSVLLYRDEIKRAKECFDESWDLSRAGSPGTARGDVHTEIVAHIGQAAFHLATGDWLQTIDYGRRGIAIADKHGIIVWSVHRLLALVAEAALWQRDLPVAEWASTRLRSESSLLEHRLGGITADCMDAYLRHFRENWPHAIPALLKAAEDANGVPYVFHAARLRRDISRMMLLAGDPDGAARELRLAHETFLQIGAALELRLTRAQMRRHGLRPPQQTIMPGGVLTGRERQIVTLVTQRKTNKEIARTLQISVRTVSTHLSNVFEKLGVDSRGALSDAVHSRPELGA